jgi:hypothetical protein
MVCIIKRIWQDVVALCCIVLCHFYMRIIWYKIPLIVVSLSLMTVLQSVGVSSLCIWTRLLLIRTTSMTSAVLFCSNSFFSPRLFVLYSNLVQQQEVVSCNCKPVLRVRQSWLDLVWYHFFCFNRRHTVSFLTIKHVVYYVKNNSVVCNYWYFVKGTC